MFVFCYSNILREQFSLMGFEVVDLPLSSSERSGEDPSAATGKNGNGAGNGKNGNGGKEGIQIQNHEEKLATEFRERVTSKCTDEAVIVVYVSGIQFPYKVRGGVAWQKGYRLICHPTLVIKY